MSDKDKPDIGDAVCVMYPARPCSSTTELPRTHDHTAFTGFNLMDPILTVAILVTVGLSALFSLRYFSKFRFVRR